MVTFSLWIPLSASLVAAFVTTRSGRRPMDTAHNVLFLMDDTR